MVVEGVAHREKGDYDQAIITLNKAIELIARMPKHTLIVVRLSG